MHKLTEIDLSDLQIGETLTIYRGSSAFLTGPAAVGYVGDATVIDVTKKKATIYVHTQPGQLRPYRLRFKDARICRVPNGEPTMLYVHARGGRPTVTAYFTDQEYDLVKLLLRDEANERHNPGLRRRRTAQSALDRMAFHDNLRSSGGRPQQ